MPAKGSLVPFSQFAARTEYSSVSAEEYRDIDIHVTASQPRACHIITILPDPQLAPIRMDNFDGASSSIFPVTTTTILPLGGMDKANTHH